MPPAKLERNLKLLIIDSLWREKVLKPFDKEKFYERVLGRTFDRSADYNYKVDRRVLKEILATELTPKHLTRVKGIYFGGNPIHRTIWTYYTGDTDEFFVHSLRGIEACTNLGELHLDPIGVGTDLSPLRALTNLRKILLYCGKPLADISPLADLPKLEKLRIMAKKNTANQKVLDALVARGVEVHAP